MLYLWFVLGGVVGAAGGLLVSMLWARRMVSRARRAEQLAQKGQTNLSGLIGGLAHELKNPLSTITVNLKLLAEDFQNAQTDRERHALVRLDVLGEETRRLSNLLDDVLKFVRHPELHRRNCDVNELMQTMVGFYSAQARSAKLTLRYQLHPDPLICDL
ncbi:MAG: HAMP domain-containing histidine kinase, partial [Phycisphaerae bacterium]|nr:HAMP domain-containing histidine kinase [Phycisphaerae bacterium]